MSLKELLSRSVESESFSTCAARELVRHDWRSAIQSLEPEVRREAETLFYFIEGFAEEVDEGFVEDGQDDELYERIMKILPKL